MKKKLIAITAMLFLAIAPAMSQILIVSEDEFNSNRAQSDAPFGVMVAAQDVDYDQYTPLGESWLLLAGLGGAYLLGKRRKNRGED